MDYTLVIELFPLFGLELLYIVILQTMISSTITPRMYLFILKISVVYGLKALHTYWYEKVQKWSSFLTFELNAHFKISKTALIIFCK